MKSRFLNIRVICHLSFKGESTVQEIAKALRAEVDDVLSSLEALLRKGLVAECTYCFTNVDGELAYVRAWSTVREFQKRRANW